MTVHREARAEDRSTGIVFRMSPADKETIRQRATEAGCTSLQGYLEFIHFGRQPVTRRSGPRGPRGQRKLPLTEEEPMRDAG